MTADAQDWTSTFPILGRKTYLASHTLGAVPSATRSALEEYHAAWDTLGIEAWEGPWWQAVLDFTHRMEGLLGAAKGTVVPLQNATRAMAGVASCLDYSGPRRRIVMTDLEFTTFYPFWGAQQRLGAELVIVPSDDRLTVPADQLAAAVDDRTLLVATCHAFFRSGALLDLEPVVEAAHEEGAYILVDGYQTVGTVPVDVARLGVDFYLGGCHKYLCGGPGAGWLYVRPDLVPTLTPRLTGWFGMQDPFSFVTDTTGATLHEGVFRFLDGTPNVPALMAAREGLRIVSEVGPSAIRSASVARTGRVIRWAEDAGLTVRTPSQAEERSGMVCLDFPGAQQATQRLSRQGVVVDWRPDCGLRMAPHFYNSDRDLDVFFESLEQAMASPAQ